MAEQLLACRGPTVLVSIARSRPRALERHRPLTIVHFPMKSAELLRFPGEFHPIKTRHRAAKLLPVDDVIVPKWCTSPKVLVYAPVIQEEGKTCSTCILRASHIHQTVHVSAHASPLL